MYQSYLHPTLYTPATMSVIKMLNIVNRRHRNTGVWRLVLDTEDAILDTEIPEALKNIKSLLPRMKDSVEVSVFVRTRTPDILAQILDMPHADKLTGFVIPKASPAGFPSFADQVVGTDFYLMPILEERRMTDYGFRTELRATLLESDYHERIDCLRIGANDLMGYLGIRRDTMSCTIYETPVGLTIHNIINEFKGAAGFTITAPVYEGFGPQYEELFRKEVMQNIKNGLFGQTVIHQRHLSAIRFMYRVQTIDLESARSILKGDHAVKGLNGRMDEKTTHWSWAELCDKRYKLFGDDSPTDALIGVLAN